MAHLGTTVELGKKIPVPALEKMLVDAAQDVGWKAEVQEIRERKYRLGSTYEMYTHVGSRVILKGLFMRAAEASIITEHRGPNVDSFFIYSHIGLGRGVATDGEVRKYLTAVSKRVGEYQIPLIPTEGPHSVRSLVV